jgi:hypothetical protein
MITDFEKWLFAGIAFILMLFVIAATLGIHSSRECRLELAKAGRSAEEIVKICP